MTGETRSETVELPPNYTRNLALIRSAALLLLVDLTNVSQTELQKLIAFEDAYARIFTLMQTEGGVTEGGITIQDYLSLLANLVRHSTSNQSLFRESGCVPRLVQLVGQASAVSPEDNDFSRSNREKNAWGLLAVIRLFLEAGEVGTKSNQDAFWRSGLGQGVLDLAFNTDAAVPIRSNALRACADMILSNGPIQEAFAGLQVPADLDDKAQTNGTRRSKEKPRTYVIEALLKLILTPSSSELFDLRSSACTLIKAYFFAHERIKHHFLQRAIAGFYDGEDESFNVLSTLMNGPSDATDPLRFIFAGDVASQLLFDDPEAKSLLMAVSEGNAEKGEDVISSTQTLSGHLMSCLQTDSEPRIAVAYLRLLSTLLFDSQPAVNDCLAEGSALLGALITIAQKSNDSQVMADSTKSLLPGMCAALLGCIYEFSSKDSPIPRRTLQPFLVTKLGRQRYFDALKQLRQHPVIRDSEIMAYSGQPPDEMQMLFDDSFIEWYKTEYGRLRRAIDKDPGIELISRDDAGVDRDILDDLRQQINSKDQALQQAEQQQLENRQKADQLDAEHRKEIQSLQSSQRTMEADVERVRRINDALHKDHAVEVERLQKSSAAELEKVQNANKVSSQSAQQQHEREVERLKGQHGASLASERSLWEEKSRKAADNAGQEARDKLEEVRHTLQSRDNELVIMRNDAQANKTDLEKSRAEVSALQRSNEQLDQDLQKTKGLQDNLQQVNSKAMARIKTLEEEAKRNENRHASITEERDSMSKDLEGARAKIKDLQDEAEGLRLELQEERKGYSELEAELEKMKRDDRASNAAATRTAQLEEDLKKRTAEVEQQKEETKKAKTELEDFLMVMSDIEAKRDEYKERLKKAGEQVSEDEEEDDGEGVEEEAEAD